MAVDGNATELVEKAKRWRVNYNNRKSGKVSARATKGGPKEVEKANMPPEHVRKIIKDHGDMSSKRFEKDKRLYLGALKYVPHSLMKLLENMPMPWEQVCIDFLSLMFAIHTIFSFVLGEIC